MSIQMQSYLSAPLVAAIATVVAALVTGALSFVNLTLNKEQKTSEFRQAWIDGLRQDLAAFFAGARTMMRATQESQANLENNRAMGRFAISPEKISEIRYQAAETHYRIKLRMNLKEPEHEELLRLIRAAINAQNNWLSGEGDVVTTEKAIDAAADYAPQILKLEWERVKSGELAFRLVRNWLAPVAFLAPVLLVIYFFTAGINQGSIPVHVQPVAPSSNDSVKS